LATILDFSTDYGCSRQLTRWPACRRTPRWLYLLDLFAAPALADNRVTDITPADGAREVPNTAAIQAHVSARFDLPPSPGTRCGSGRADSASPPA
jgi:hypothetical protein